MPESEHRGDMTQAFAEALEAAHAPVDDASPASPPEPVPDDGTPADAGESAPATTAQVPESTEAPVSVTADDTPVPSAEEPVEEPSKGEPPKWRWQDILANARDTVARETEERIRREYADLHDFQGLDAQQREGLRIWQRALSGDPEAVRQVQSVAQANPAVAQTIQQFVAGRGSPAEAPEPEPDVDIETKDGALIPTYTAEGLKRRDAWLLQQWQRQIQAQLEPYEGLKARLQQADELRQVEAQHKQWAESVVAPIAKLPYFKDALPEIQKAFAALPETATDHEMQQAVYDAYTQFHTAKITELTKQGASKAVAELQQRAIAGTPSPGQSSPSEPRTFKPGAEGFAEALEHFGGGGSQ